MIELIFSYVNRLKSRLITVTETGTVDMYGSGELGNVYYGNCTTEPPDILKWDHVKNNTSDYYLPMSHAAHFKNLYIDANVNLWSPSDWCTIMVSDTLYLHGRLTCDNSHSGDYFATEQDMPTFANKLRMYGESNYLPEKTFCITGGTGNPCFGNSTKGGGFLAIYYTNAYNLSGTTIGTQEISDFQNFSNVRGGSDASPAGSKSGGYMVIAARRLAINTATGRFYNHGGDGQNADTAGMLLPYKVVARTNL